MNLLAKREGFDVEFKENVNGVDRDILVAFANSPGGGTILAGVKDSQGADGRQVGVVVGCPIGDPQKLVLLNKASSCRPAIEIEVYEEEVDDKNFYRIEVPSGPYKPYCLSGGTYLIRGDGRNNALQPNQLLALYLDVEGNQFLGRFRAATESMQHDLDNMTQTITKSSSATTTTVRREIDHMAEVIARLSGETSEQLENLVLGTQGAADDSIDVAADLHSAIGELGNRLDVLEGVTHHNNLMLAALLTHFGLENPNTSALREALQQTIRALWPTFQRKELIIETIGKGLDVDPATLENWVDEVIAELQNQESNAGRN